MDSNFLEKEIILPPAKIDKRKKENRTPKGDNDDPEMLKRSRKWVVTINNYDKEDIAKFDNLECRYSMRSLEKGEKNGTPHIQGYVELHAAVTRKTLSKRLPRASLRKAYGTRDENLIYISKDENPTLLEKGTPGAQGKRWDLDKVRNVAIYDGMKQVVTDFGYQAIRVAQLYLDYNEPCRKVKPHVAWIWGGTTTGKTSSAFKMLGGDLDEIYIKSDPKRWFYGYDGHKKVVLNEFRDDWEEWPLSFLLQLLRDPCRVETKERLATIPRGTDRHHLPVSSGEDVSDSLSE